MIFILQVNFFLWCWRELSKKIEEQVLPTFVFTNICVCLAYISRDYQLISNCFKMSKAPFVFYEVAREGGWGGVGWCGKIECFLKKNGHGPTPSTPLKPAPL